jgi:hypothetical protein
MKNDTGIYTRRVGCPHPQVKLLSLPEIMENACLDAIIISNDAGAFFAFATSEKRWQHYCCFVAITLCGQSPFSNR